MRHQRGHGNPETPGHAARFPSIADVKLTVPVAEYFRQSAPRLASLRRLPAEGTGKALPVSYQR
jgi:hypothetical protein